MTIVDKSTGLSIYFMSSNKSQEKCQSDLLELLFKEVTWFEASRSEVKVTQSCPTLWDPMDYTVRGILQARIREWVAFPFSRDLPNPRIELVSPCRQILYQLSHQGSPRILEWVAYLFSRGSSRLRNQTGVFCTAGGFLTSWATREAPYRK